MLLPEKNNTFLLLLFGEWNVLFFRKRKLLLLKALWLFVTLQFSTLFLHTSLFLEGWGVHLSEGAKWGEGEIFFPSLSISQTCSSSSSECFFPDFEKGAWWIATSCGGGEHNRNAKKTQFRFFGIYSQHVDSKHDFSEIQEYLDTFFGKK